METYNAISSLNKKIINGLGKGNAKIILGEDTSKVKETWMNIQRSIEVSSKISLSEYDSLHLNDLLDNMSLRIDIYKNRKQQKNFKKDIEIETIIQNFIFIKEVWGFLGKLNEPHDAFSFFPRFFVLSTMTVLLSKDLMESEKIELEKQSFLDCSHNYLVNCIESLYLRRISYISVSLTGPYNNKAYVYDGFDNCYLTDLVDFDADSAKSLSELTESLKNKIGRCFTENLPFDFFLHAIFELDGAKTRNDEYTTKKILNDIFSCTESMTTESMNDLIGNVLLESVKNKYFSVKEKKGDVDNSIEIGNVVVSYVPTAVEEKNLVVDTSIEIGNALVSNVPSAVAATIIEGLLDPKTYPYISSVLTGVAGAFIGPLAGVLVGLVLPSDKLTMEQILKEVEKLVMDKISDLKFNDIKLLCNETENANSYLQAAIKDNLQEKIRSEAINFRQKTKDLENEFFKSLPELEKHHFQYRLAWLCVTVMMLRFAALMKSMDIAVQDKANNTIKELLLDFDAFINSSYSFLDKLYNQAWTYQGYRGIRQYDHNGFIGIGAKVSIYDFVAKRELSDKYKDSDCGSNMRSAAALIDERTRFFSTESTYVRNASVLHDSIVKKYNEITKKSLPSALDKYKENSSKRINAMKDMYKYAISRDYKVYHYLRTFGIDTNSPPHVDNAIVKVYSIKGEFLLDLGIGFCPGIKEAIHAGTNKNEDRISFHIPWGIRVKSVSKEYGTLYYPRSTSDMKPELRIMAGESIECYIDIQYYFGLCQLSHVTNKKLQDHIVIG
ncbi:hypothetical protein PJX95_19105 [Serratia rubidaea]|uniref:hypothetical protein n=1 Tax=Serratia rubidaea TaxID=61652 RepID=UPI00234B8E8D|nr:hypothetical protein [Serratia rubidaea]MDC6120166.1 hypothetical protein [Serratia rubidaea]MEB7583957.1 hypothetical protein [Serratia rubidaea]